MTVSFFFNTLFVISVLLIIVVIFFYGYSISKIKARRAQITEFQRQIVKGVRVEFAGGMLGKIQQVGDEYLEVEIAPKVTIQVSRYSVTRILTNDQKDK